MAYEIRFTPPSLSSIQDDLIWTVRDLDKTNDPLTYPNFKFIGDVYIDSVLVARVKKIPDPENSIGIFNLGQIIRNYVETTFNPTGSFVSQQLGLAEFNTKVQIKFGEEYNFTTFVSTLIDSERTFFNNYNGRLIGNTSSLTDKQNKIASNRPLIGKVRRASPNSFISYFATNTTPVPFTIAVFGGGSGFGGNITPDAANNMIVLNVSPAALNAAAPGTINASTTHYTLTIAGQVYTFEILCEPIYETFTLHWLNQYGGFDSKLFNKVSRKSFDIQKKDFGKLPYSVDSSGNVTYKNANNVYNESRSVYSSQYKEKLVVNSDLLTDDEYRWLKELMVSTLVYFEDQTYFFPIAISENNYEERKLVNDEWTNLTLSFEFGNQLNAQYR